MIGGEGIFFEPFVCKLHGIGLGKNSGGLSPRVFCKATPATCHNDFGFLTQPRIWLQAQFDLRLAVGEIAEPLILLQQATGAFVA